MITCRIVAGKVEGIELLVGAGAAAVAGLVEAGDARALGAVPVVEVPELHLLRGAAEVARRLQGPVVGLLRTVHGHQRSVVLSLPLLPDPPPTRWATATLIIGRLDQLLLIILHAPPPLLLALLRQLLLRRASTGLHAIIIVIIMIHHILINQFSDP